MAHFTCEVVYRGIFQKNLASRMPNGLRRALMQLRHG